MKKIICFPFRGDNLGGSHIIALDIIKSLRKKKYKVIIVLHKKGKLSNYLKEKKIKFLFLPIKDFEITKKNIIFNFFSILKILFKITFFIKKNKINTIHTNTTDMHLLWLFPSKFIRSQIIWHLHAKFPSWPLFNILSKRADKFIAISNYVLNSVPKKLKNNTFLLRNCIKTNFVKTNKKKNSLKLRNSLGINKDTKIILFFSNFYKRKQPYMFIKIAKKILMSSKKDFFFLMAGDDRDITRAMLLKEIKKSKLQNNFCLYKFQNDKNYIISGSDLLITPSIEEPFGLTLIESMEIGTPVIALKSGGHKEIIRNNYNGILINKNEADIYMKKIYKLFNNNNLRNKIIKNEKTYLKNNNNFNHYVKNLIKIYQVGM